MASQRKDFQEDFSVRKRHQVSSGANAGNFMHDIFEHIDFSDSSNWKVSLGKVLQYHQYSSRNGHPQ